MCFLPCCTCTCCNVVYYICLVIVFIYLVLCVVLIPKYRFVALMVLGIVALYATSAWRLLPSERLVVQRMAETIARQRCSQPLEAALLPCSAISGTTTSASAIVGVHEPVSADLRAA